MAEWLRPWLWEILTIKLRGIKPGQVLITKKTIGWADGVKITPRRYCGRHKPDFVGSITSSYILSPHKKSIGWTDGVKITSRRYYGRRKPNLVRGQDGRVVKAGSLECTHD